MNLRKRQEGAIEMLKGSIRRGNKRIVLAAPCSFGKTVVSAHMMMESQKKGKKGVLICDRIQLVEQALEKFDELGLHVGVIQGTHHRADPTAPIQIASIQTLARRNRILEFDFAIIDECHTHYQTLTQMMLSYNNVVFIGLSATPYSKGLGQHYSDIVVPATTRELLADGDLCPVKYYAGEQPDLERIKLKGISTGGQDYDEKSLSIEMEQPKLIGDVVQTWLKLGESSQTISFSPSIKHSKGLVDAFREAGVEAVHIDAYTDPDERKEIYKAHNDGEFKILSCSVLLNTGYDAPTVRCLIDCYPVKSIIRYVQRAGRIMRTSPGKEYAIYLDHASNVCAHGFAEDIEPESLHDGSRDYREQEQVKKKESQPTICECCSAIMVGLSCKVCGHALSPKKELITVPGELQEVKAVDQEFYSGLLWVAREKGYAPGWAANVYKEKYGSWPNGANKTPQEPNQKVKGYVKYRNIKRAKSHKINRIKGDKAISEIMESISGSSN